MKYIVQNKNEVILKLDGRMANQMFEWAFARAFEAKNGILPLIDNSKETLKLNHFAMFKELKTIKQPFWNKFLRKVIIFRNLRNRITELKFDIPTYSEPDDFDENMFNIKAPAYIKGYFQNEKYFNDVRELLIKDFKLTAKLNQANKKMLEMIKNTESVAVHFRRGDYTKKRVADYFGVCSVEYYQKAVKTVADKLDKKPTLFIFSDDINWVRQNVNFDYETVYVDINSGKKGFFDMELMKNCRHNIIANSSFSWMSAWLNENPDKIIVAPTPWTNDETKNREIVPENWIKLEK